MMLKRLRSWQPEASEEQLSAFIQEHGMLLDLLDESWQKFVKQRAELFQAAKAIMPRAFRWTICAMSRLPMRN